MVTLTFSTCLNRDYCVVDFDKALLCIIAFRPQITLTKKFASKLYEYNIHHVRKKRQIRVIFNQNQTNNAKMNLNCKI